MTMNQLETNAIVDSQRQQRQEKNAGGSTRKVLYQRASSSVDGLYETVSNDLLKGSQFFEEQNARPIPKFRSTDFTLGVMLGRGEFGTVMEISSFKRGLVPPMQSSLANQDEKATKQEPSQGTSIPNNETSSIDRPVTVVSFAAAAASKFETERTYKSTRSLHEDPDESSVSLASSGASSGFSASDYGEEDDWERLVGSEDLEHQELKRQMMRHPTRQGIARYAVKMLREDVRPDLRCDAILDLACEAEFLSRVVHPNIVRLRATAGTPGASSFMILMDRLNGTMDTKIDEWKETRKHATHLFRRNNRVELDRIYHEQVLASYDIARALRFLHRSRLLYRDLKPENVGLDCRLQWRIFDFGLCKELKQVDKVKGKPDCYRATGLTGSRRYMAPEIAKCLDYGFSADVFSFGIMMWQIFALEMPFKDFDHGTHMEKVVIGGSRPRSIRAMSSKTWHKMMEDCWSDDPPRRPQFGAICQVLERELAVIAKDGDMGGAHLSNRSAYLLNQSLRSQRQN